MKTCSYRYHSTFAGDKSLVCPSCHGKGKIQIVSERGVPIPQKPHLIRDWLIVALEWVVLKIKGDL